MKVLQDRDRAAVEERLRDLDKPVRIVHFTQELDCPTCRDARWLLEDVVSLSDKLSLEVFNLQIDKEKAADFKVDKVPATAIVAEKDYGIRFYGVPSGYEFVTFLSSLLSVSRGESGVRPETAERLRTLTKPLHLQVFVTPT